MLQKDVKLKELIPLTAFKSKMKSLVFVLFCVCCVSMMLSLQTLEKHIFNLNGTFLFK